MEPKKQILQPRYFFLADFLCLCTVMLMLVTHVYATNISFTAAVARLILPDDVMGQDYCGPSGGGPTVPLEYGSSTPFLLYGGWGVDTPYQDYGLRLLDISYDEIQVSAAISQNPPFRNDVELEVITPVFYGTPKGIYYPPPNDSELAYYVYPEECIHFITNSGWLADGADPDKPWHTSNCGFYICPQPGCCYTHSFRIEMTVGTCSDPNGGTGSEVGIGATYNFTVPEPLSVLAPNGGENLAVGTTYRISWETLGTIEYVCLEYSTNNGQSWVTVDPVAANTGTYEWEVPLADSNECFVRISDANHPTVGDTSDATFTIFRCQAMFSRFTDINAAMVPLHCRSLAWGDYDNDGDPDLANPYRIYRNDRNGTFTEIDANLPAFSYASVAWGDCDNDGDLDLVTTGQTGGEDVCKIYRNDRADAFTEIETGLPGVKNGWFAFGDYDNDGDLDLAITGSGISKIYRNDPNMTFTDINAGLVGVSLGASLDWGDYDNDGDLDLALAGCRGTQGNVYLSIIYRNDGGGTFTDIGAGLLGVWASSLAWGDYDNDGDLDLAIAGYAFGLGPTSRIYRNDGDGIFTDIRAALGGAHRCSVGWGDYDNDGDLDLAIAGTSKTKVYRNDAGMFTDINTRLVPMKTNSCYCALAWGDYDIDGDLDLALVGESFDGFVAKIYRNDGRFPIAGDLNNDCYIDFTDFAIFSRAWLDCVNRFDPACGVQ